MKWNSETKKAYFEGWDAARIKLKQILDNDFHGNRAALIFFAYIEQELRPWMDSTLDGTPPECPATMKEEASVRDIASLTSSPQLMDDDRKDSS